MFSHGLAKQAINLFDEETSDKAKELAQAYKEARNTSQVEAVIIRSEINKQLYNVYLVDYSRLHQTQLVLEEVLYDVASKYVLLYNQEAIDSTEESEVD